MFRSDDQHAPGALKPLSGDWAVTEQAEETWEDLGLDVDAMLLWRRAGFSSAESSKWTSAFGDSGSVSRWDPSEMVRVASAWTVAGFTPECANDWDDLLSPLEVMDRPISAREWVSSGFDVAAAKLWAEREPLEAAVLLHNGGWRPWQRDLLDIFLGFPAASDSTRCRLIGSALAPEHVLDYLRAGIEPSEFAWYERLRRAGQLEQDLEARAVKRSFPRDTRFRVNWVLSTAGFDPQVLHRRRFEMPDEDANPNTFSHRPVPPMPTSWHAPELVETWRENGGMPVFVTDGEWMMNGCPEDHSLEPIFARSKEDRETVRLALSGNDEDIAFCEISWPPSGSLWKSGWAGENWPSGCDNHEEFEASCPECQVPELYEIEPAEWHWHVDVTLQYKDEDGSFDREEHSSEHILTTEVDPRTVEYCEYALR